MAAFRHDGVEAPDQPVLVISLEGWIDAGFAGASASGALLDSFPTEVLYSFDADALIDRRARRPRMRIEDGVRTGLTWSEPTVRVGVDAAGKGIALLVGPEPDYGWQGFASDVCDIVRSLGTGLVVSLGGFPAAWPHTRPVRLASTASNPALARQVGFVPGTLDAPAGIGDVLGAACAEFGVASVGLWARVPHYVAAMPFPAAAVALLEGLETLSGVHADTAELEESAKVTRARVDELIGASDEHREMVRLLEEQVESFDADESNSFGGGIPSGDEIAAELERYLRGEMQ